MIYQGLPTEFIEQLRQMSDDEVAIAAATYRSSGRRKGLATDLILSWFRRERAQTREVYEQFLLTYSRMWQIVKLQRRLGAKRPEKRPVSSRWDQIQHRPIARSHPEHILVSA